MTEEEKKAVEAEEAKKKAEEAAAQQKADEEGLGDVVVKTFTDLEKARKERDNYREGLLKAKGKKADDETDEERIERIVAEKIASSQLGTLVTDFQTKLTTLVKENKELKIANKAKSSMDSKDGGGNQDRNRDVTTDPLASIPADLKARIANLSEASQKKLIARWKASGVIK